MTMDEQNRFSEEVRIESDTPLASMADFAEADYLHHLDGLDVTPEQASELLRIVWDMMRMCAEMNLPPESWGQIATSAFACAACDSAEVE